MKHDFIYSLLIWIFGFPKNKGEEKDSRDSEVMKN